jgi:hypothetical protein
MLGALGALIPEALQYSGATSFLEARWWAVGGAKLDTNEDLNYLGVSGLRIAGGQGILIIAICQARTHACMAAPPHNISRAPDKSIMQVWRPAEVRNCCSTCEI